MNSTHSQEPANLTRAMPELHALVPMAHVVPRSIAFYEQLGFEVRNCGERLRNQEIRLEVTRCGQPESTTI